MRAIWHGEQHLIFFVASFWLQKKLFGKTFWNKVVKKKRCGRSYWRVPICNPLKDKDIVSYRSSCPPCRGLEDRLPDCAPDNGVVRRVGGLEDLEKDARAPLIVVRRVGGLEGVGGITCESSAIDEETEAR